MILAPLYVAPWCNSEGMIARAAARAAGVCPAVDGPAVYWVWGGMRRAPAARCAS